jgi:uncharacterized protein (DUF488 family)
MSSPSLYTLGYAQWSIEEVDRQIDELDALLVDVRHSPYTSKPGFSKPELASRFGTDYLHAPEFGNINYDKEEPMSLADPADGLRLLRARDGPFVLLCGCRDPERCHRSRVAVLIQDELGGSITNLRAPSERAQHSLFSSHDSTEK